MAPGRVNAPFPRIRIGATVPLMRHSVRTPHTRALRACLAVTLGGAACTSRAAESDDAPELESAEVAVPITAVPAGTGDGAIERAGEAGSTAEGSADAPDIVTPLDEPSRPEIARPDAGTDGEAQCSHERDEQCPEGCDRNTDIDCCEGDGPASGLCQFVPDFGCRCAVIGPFNPPEIST